MTRVVFFDELQRFLFLSHQDAGFRQHDSQELDPSSPAILADKGILLFKAGKKQQAIELLKEVERTDPKFRSPHYYLMLISFSLRDYPTYLAEGEKAARAANDSC